MDRLQLNALLKTITTNVYYQPPASVKMVYPCIRYNRTTGIEMPADNKSLYLDRAAYELVYISRTPDDSAVDSLRALNYCRFNGVSTSDNLYHYRFKIYL